MKKETVKKILVFVIILLFVVISLFFADVYKIINKSEPLFCIEKKITSVSKEYIGVGYKILIRTNNDNIEEIKFGTLFSNLEEK